MNLISLQHLVRSVRTLAEDCQVIVLGCHEQRLSHTEPLRTVFALVCQASAPKGHSIAAQGNALGYGFPEHLGALKGRLNS